MADTQTTASADNSESASPKSLLSPAQRSRLVLLMAMVLSYLAFYWVSRTADIPHHRGYEISVLQQPGSIGKLALIAVVFAGVAALASVVTGLVRFDAGLLVAGVGLMAVSLQGGTMRDVLFWAEGSPRVFPMLAGELALLMLPIGAVWWVTWRLWERGTLKTMELDPALDKPPTQAKEAQSLLLRRRLIHLLIQTGGTMLGVLLIVRSDDKGQVLAGVWLAAFFATGWAQHAAGAATTGPWLWIGPTLAGVIGYLIAWLDPAGANIGQLSGDLGALARPLPLDYASMGTAGAVLGRWPGAAAVKAIRDGVVGIWELLFG
jgi:hypothetical protein